MRYSYNTNGVCAKNIEFDYDGNVVTNVEFTAGCNGNLNAISALVDGLTPEQIIKKCEGIKCGMRETSCTDQFSIALKEAMKEFQK